MNSRDLIFLVMGVLAGLAGIVTTVVWSVEAGIIALLAMSVIFLVLLILQRRQIAKLQQRMLSVLNHQQKAKAVTEKNQPIAPKRPESIAIPTKKIVGLLQAQQVSMEMLNAKLERALNSDSDSTSDS